MDERKNKKVKQKIIFAAIFVTLAMIAEIFIAMKVTFYPIVFAIVAAVLAVVAMYILVSGLLEFFEMKNQQRDEQYEDTIKSQKASYILHKKYFEALEKRMSDLEKNAALPTEEIVTAQKGIAKVIISRSRENTEATLSSHEQIIELLNTFEKQLHESNAGLVEQLHENNAGLVEQLSENNAGLVAQLSGNNTDHSDSSFSEEAIQQLIDRQQEILANLKDMEMRMNDAILQSRKAVVEQVAASEPVMLEEEIIPEEPVMLEEEIIPEEPVILEEEVVEEKPPMPDLSDPNKQMSPDEIAALFANLS